MSKATKRKHVTKEVLEDYYIPEGDEEIVKILGGRGNNLHEVENAYGKSYLVSMPTKFRRNVWVKRGDYVVTEPIKEGHKVQGEIVYILMAKQIKYLKDENLWPKEYDRSNKEIPDNDEREELKMNGNHASDRYSENSDSDSDDDDELFHNPNHRPMCYVDSTEESSSEDDDEDGDDEDDEEDEGEDAVEGDREKEEDETQSKFNENKLNEEFCKVSLK